MSRNNLYRLLKHLTFGKTCKYFDMLSRIKNNKILIVKKDGKIKEIKKVKGLTIKFLGQNSVVKIHEPYRFINCYFEVGDDNIIEIKQTNFYIKDLIIPARMSRYSKLLIDSDCSVEGAKIWLHDEPERIVKIGKDCMLSFDITIWPSDGHAIIDDKGDAINKPKNIMIGNHVWVGTQCLILKGANIPDGSILGARTLYTSASNPKNSKKPYIFCGQPAKVLKSGNFIWDRNNTYYFNKKDYK